MFAGTIARFRVAGMVLSTTPRLIMKNAMTAILWAAMAVPRTAKSLMRHRAA